MVWTKFNPQGILGKTGADKDWEKVNLKFDAVDIFLILGSKYEHVKEVDEFGILDSGKSYMIIFAKSNMSHATIVKDFHAVYLWKGADQSSVNLVKALNRF